MKLKHLKTEDLIGLIEMAATCFTDGHITLMKFTTGWKCKLGTIDIDSGNGRTEINELETFETIDAAIVNEIKRINKLRRQECLTTSM